jgi:hypothetical protein
MILVVTLAHRVSLLHEGKKAASGRRGTGRLSGELEEARVGLAVNDAVQPRTRLLARGFAKSLDE